MHRRRVLVLLLAFLPGCGEDIPPPPGPNEPPPRAERSEPTERREVPPVPDEERGRFALSRLLEGPLPRTSTFAIPRLHALNLEHARRDLLALADTTAVLLADRDLAARVTGGPGQVSNAWHGVLDVLLSLEGFPEDYVLAWTAPAITHPEDLPLVRRAARLLARHASEENAPVLMEFLEAYPQDREVTPTVVQALVQLSARWRTSALDLLLAHGTVEAWDNTRVALHDHPAALAWWGLSTEMAAPRPTLSAGRFARPSWAGGLLLRDPTTWPDELRGRWQALATRRPLARALLEEPQAWIPRAAGSSPLIDTGLLAHGAERVAARARCQLGRDNATGAARILAERESPDPVLAALARECDLGALEPEETRTLRREAARFEVEMFLESLSQGLATPSPDLARTSLGLLFAEVPEEGRAAAWRILREARPPSVHSRLLEDTHDLLLVHDEAALRTWVTEKLEDPDPVEQELALALARRAPDVHYVAAIQRSASRASNDTARGAFQRLLVWVLARGNGVTDEERARQVPHVASWLEDAPDSDVIGLAPGLLDLGPRGAEAYARGLSGPRRALYVQGLLGVERLVPLSVVEALLDRIDASTSIPERHAAWIIAYRSAPSEAASALAAARRRLPANVSAESDDVWENVRHRALR